jgi:hypothetical protein
LAVAARLHISPRMKFRQLAALLLIALAPSIPRPIGACSLEPRDGGIWQAEPIEGDTQAPTQLTATYGVDWPEDGSSVACGGGGSCGVGPAYFVFHLSAVDDNVASEALGYRFVVVGGEPPRGFDATQPLMPDPYAYGDGAEIGISFSRDDNHFSFDLQITAIDRNGNESDPIVIEIEG